MTNGVRGRGPHLSGSTAGGAAPYGSARGPILRGTPRGTRTSRHGARACGKHDPRSPIAPRRPVGLARHCSAHATAARAGTSRARPSRTSLTPHRRSRTSPRIAAQARPRDRGAGRPRKLLRELTRARRESSRTPAPMMGGPSRSPRQARRQPNLVTPGRSGRHGGAFPPHWWCTRPAGWLASIASRSPEREY